MTDTTKFNVGDIVREYNAYGEYLGKRKIIRITPTGRIRLDNGGFYRMNGASVSNTPGYGNGRIEKVVSFQKEN